MTEASTSPTGQLDQLPGSQNTLDKVHTSLKPIAPPGDDVGQVQLTRTQADTSSASERLHVARQRNLDRLLRPGPDRSWWREWKYLVGEKSRPQHVTAAQLREVFHGRMNPPEVLPSQFDPLQHAIMRLSANTMPRRSADCTDGQFFSRPFSDEDIEGVKAHIRRNCLGASKGLDDVSYEQIINVPTSELRTFLQACIDSGEVPQKWIVATIAAVKKPRKDGSLPESYRTIGLESCLLKTMTLLIDRRIREWAEQTGRLPDSQSGFRKGHRTINNPFVLRAAIEKAGSMGKTLYVVFLDIVNAFPSVNQATLWVKLARWGASGPLIDWLRSLYSRLEYLVRFNGETTETFRALAGILIGDPASPILWILFISDLDFTTDPDDITLNGRPVNHLELADDATLLTTVPPAVQQKLYELCIFLALNFLLIGPAKTNAMAFGPLPPTLPILTVEGDPVAFVETARYTGTTFSSTARDIFVHHYITKAKSARNIANASLSLESYVGPLPPSTAAALYNARVEPHLTMSCEVALDVSPSSLEHLERVQVTYLRRLLRLGPRSQLLPLYTESGVWPLRYRRADLALKYLTYLLHTRPALPFAALQESWQIAQCGHTSWWSDLTHVLANLPVPVGMDRHTFPTQSSVSDARRVLRSSLTLHLRDGVLNSGRLPLLGHRFRRLATPPRLAEVCTARSYLKIPCTEHREALTRLLTSEHPLAVETLRRTTPPVPRERRICRFCQKRWAVETELHVLLECSHESISLLRDSFYSGAALAFRGDLGRMRDRLSPPAFFDALLRKDACLPAMAHYVYDIFELVDTVPPLMLIDDTAFLALSE